MKDVTKIIVISDTHGRNDHVIDEIKKLNGDMILHLGDHVGDAEKISKKLDKEVIAVRGNCDYLDGNVKEDRLLKVSDKRIFMTHGHRYSAKAGINNLFYRGKEYEADIVLFGHTHMPYMGEYENVKLFNPGSASFPRGGSRASIGIIEIDKEINMRIINI